MTTDTANPLEVLERLRNVSHDDLDDAYCPFDCEVCGMQLKHLRTESGVSVPRGKRKLYCPKCDEASA